MPTLFQSLCESAGAMLEHGDLSIETLSRRANWLAGDIEVLALESFKILPTRWIEPPGYDLRFPLVEYEFGKTDHDVENATNPFLVPKDVRLMMGTGLSQEDLLHFSKVSEIGHTVIPNLWLADVRLRRDMRLPTQHLDSLNEVWWLSRWQGIDSDSVKREHLVRRDSINLAKKAPSTIDWRFSLRGLLGDPVALNISVKNRRGTIGSRPFKKGVYLFGDEPDKPFAKSSKDEINVLATTAYHGGWITEIQEAELVQEYLDCMLVKAQREVIDAVALSVRGGPTPTSYDKLYFSKTRDVAQKIAILKSIYKPMDFEDHAKIGMHIYPMSFADAFDLAGSPRTP